MHATMAHSSLCGDSHQEDFGADLQMSRQKCNINQQRRGRRRAWRGPDGICGSFSLAIFVLTICMAHTSSTVAAIESSTSSSSSTSPTIVMVAVTPSIGSSGGNSNITTEAPPEQQQPQGQCLLDGQWVPETTVHCEKHTSCRAIQRTGHCCPDYKCDCEKDGKTYANGYKLVDPDTPCTVCYCKGGEVVCSSVTCFRRDDCMPKYVPGRCCPEYDNCPILDNNPPLSSETSSTSTTTSTQKPAGVAQSAGFNWNITIKEITKPSEIRITDDNKSKSAIPTRKSGVTTEGAPASSAATTTSSNSVASTTDTTTAATATKATTAAADSTTATEATTTTVVISSTEAATTTPATLGQLGQQLSQDTNPKVLPGTSSSESLKLIAAASAGFIGRPQSGNEVEQNTKLPADGPLPFAENDPSKVSFKREFTTERPSTQGYEESGAVAVAAEAAVFIEDASAELPDGEQEPDTAGSDNIYHIISTTEGPSSSSPLPGSSSPKGRNSTEADMSTEGPGSSTEMPPMSSTQHMDADEDVPQVESNPAYPSLPEDDFSLRDVNFPLVDLEDIADSYAKDEPRSILRSPFEVDNKRTKVLQDSTVDGSGSGSGSGDMEPYLEESSTVGHSKERSSMVPLLMYSAEDNSGETRFQNASDLQLENVGRRQKESETSEELTGGSGEIKEPTTPRSNPSTALDIDELGSGAGQLQASSAVDPKADAESLKLDESQETVAKMTSADDKSSVRAEKSLVELAMPLGRLYLQRIY